MTTFSMYALCMDMPVPFQLIETIVLFLVVIGLLFYVLVTSGKRESRLLALLERYTAQLARLADQLELLTRDVSDIAKRLERVEYRAYSHERGVPTVNVSHVGEHARVGQAAQGKGLAQEAT